MFGIAWTTVNALFSIFPEGNLLHLSFGVSIVAFLAAKLEMRRLI